MTSAADLISPELVLVASPEEAEEARRSLPPLPPPALSAVRAAVSVPHRQEPNPDRLAVLAEAPALTRPARDRRQALRVAAGVGALVALGALGFAGSYELRKPGANLTKQTPAFAPARVFGWVKQSGADAYVIRFFRNDRLVLDHKTTEARYVLPAGFRFTPGTYRWEVMPVTGEKLGPAIVTARFVIA